MLTSGLFAVTYLLLLRLSLSALSSAISSSFTPYSYSSRYDGPRSDPVRCSRRSALPLLFRVSYPNKCICRLWLNRVFNANDICNRTMSFLQSAYRTPCNSDQQDNFERYEFHRCISVFFQLPAFTVSSHVRTSIDSASNLISPSSLIFASSLDNEVR